MAGISDIRPSPIAGTWYTADPKRLAHQVDEYLAAAKLPDLHGEVIGIIAPHAGHRYSGPTAGYAFRAIQRNSYDLVVVISPMHGFHPASLLTTAHTAYSTPLGNIPVDAEAIKELTELMLQQSGADLFPVANDGEHSLEIELPFLQRAVEGDFHLLPVMVRTQSARTIEILGKSLAKVMASKKSLLVASTDLSHFYPQATAQRLDTGMLEAFSSLDPMAILDAEETGKGYACGAPAVAAVMWAARELGANKVEILHHSTSGDVTGDYNQVVGYGAAVLLKTG